MAENQTEGSSIASDGQSEENELPTSKIRWVIPNQLEQMAFVGKDVCAIAQDLYIIFLNLKTNTETIYVANSQKTGDGVDCVAGHKSHMFVFAEKVKHARIFVVDYPSFEIITELKDEEVNRYKALCMMESDLIVGFSGFPNYALTVWSWRLKQRLMIIPTGVVRRSQIYLASRTHMLVCQCWGLGLNVWEVAQCFHHCLMMKRSKEQQTGWQLQEPPMVGLAWSNEGQLYAIDPQANLYSIMSDGIGMISNLEWSEDLSGDLKPSICPFGNGLLIYGPDQYLRALKKAESKWKVCWSFQPEDEVLRLIANASCDVALMWTAAGRVYRLAGEAEDKIEARLVTFKQRNIKKAQLLAPEYQHLMTIDTGGLLCVYEVLTAKLVCMRRVGGTEVSFQASPVEPLIVVFGAVRLNYGMLLLKFSPTEGLTKAQSVCLTHQSVTHVVFSPSGREVVAAAMSAGHIFIYKLSPEHRLSLVRYCELGRGLADCLLLKVGDAMRCLSLLLVSDKYRIGERVICINTETGKDNKFAGKMQGPYARLLPLATADTVMAIPHQTRQFHILKLAADKGVTVSVKMGPIIEASHDIKYFDAFYNVGALLTFGYDGEVVNRQPDAPVQYDLKLTATHRYEKGLSQALIDASNQYLVTLAGNRTLAVQFLDLEMENLQEEVRHEVDKKVLDGQKEVINIISESDKNYLDLQEEKKVKEEEMDYRSQRREVVENFLAIQKKVVELLEENLVRPPLQQLGLGEFNLHQEHKKERMKQAEKEREEIRLKTEALIKAQDKVTLWIKTYCWDTMMTPRVKLLAIFSHYQVENYAVLPTQRDKWPELNQVEALRSIESRNDEDLFQPWLPWEPPGEAKGPSEPRISAISMASVASRLRSSDSVVRPVRDPSSDIVANPHVLSGSALHRYVPPPAFDVPQTQACSFLQMNWLHQLLKLNVQNMRLWFNKQFDELMELKKREVGLVGERNARLRFIIEELNKLSDLRGSFHHLIIPIKDPEWTQEEQPEKLTKVEPEECSIEPYISPSQIVIPPPEGGPKDDFRERALIEMMDGVLEKLWHEEIKKPIPMPQCMLDKDPEHFNEDDLRLVFDYEAKVRFREEERDKYRKMLHAEYAKLTAVLNEGVVKFNQKVKETWLTKLRVDSVIGQENLNLMRLRRVNLDRVEAAEQLEVMRNQIARYESEIEHLHSEVKTINAQSALVQTTYDNLSQKDKYLERTFKNHFADLSPIIVDQCYKFFKKRPKWQQRATMTPTILYELAQAVLTSTKPANLHADCLDYCKGVEQLDQISNMPPVMDEGLWATMIKLRRGKIENEIRMRAVAQEMAYVDSANSVWSKAIQARRAALHRTSESTSEHRQQVEHLARNKTLQLVLPAGQVEIVTTGHFEDFDDATLIRKEDIETINNVILKVGELKLRMMRKQMEFRKGILSKEWEHAFMKMKLRHMQQELSSYQRLKIPKELQYYLKNKEQGYTDDQDYIKMEKEMEASKVSVNKILTEQIHRVEELQLKVDALAGQSLQLENQIADLNVKVSEKRLSEDPLEPIRIRRAYKKRMDTLVLRSHLIREVQSNHTTIVLLQTELELLRLKTFPTLASFRTFS